MGSVSSGSSFFRRAEELGVEEGVYDALAEGRHDGVEPADVAKAHVDVVGVDDLRRNGSCASLSRTAVDSRHGLRTLVFVQSKILVTSALQKGLRSRICLLPRVTADVGLV